MFENEFPAAACKNEEHQHSEERTPTALGIASSGVMNVPKREPSMNISFVEEEEEEAELLDDLLPPIQSRKLFKLKDPVVVLERCDKIWETLELIKALQNNASMDGEAPSDREEGEEDEDEDHSPASEEMIEGPPTPPVENPKTYIEYQPRLNNGNSALPNFIFSVKSTKPLYQCSKCGKQYSEQKALRRHSEKIHGIGMLRRKNSSKFKKPQDTASSDTGESSKSSGSSSSNSRTEECIYGDRENGKLPKPVQSSKLAGFDPSSSIDKTEKINSKVPPKPQDSKKPDPEHNVNMNYCCTLCQREFRRIRRHLTEYHKIKQPENVVLELIRQSVIPGRLKTGNSAQTKTESVPPTSKPIENPDSGTNKRKRTSSSSSLDSYKKLKVNQESGKKLKYNRLRCTLCLGVYSSLRSLAKHKLSHERFKETEENIDLWRHKYRNSPFRYQGQEQSQNPGKEGEEPEREQESRRLTRSDSRKDDSDEETACICGRLFRNPHTLYVHKSVCKMTKEDEGTANKGSTTMNTSIDRDSGIGINITIKKKNDSYEIVSRDSGDEERPKDSEGPENDDDDDDDDDDHEDDEEDLSSNASTPTLNNNNTEELLAMESSKYSKDHSIMKLQFVEEDMDVDILNDSQETPPPESASSPNSLENHSAKPKTLERVVKVKCNLCNKLFRSKVELKTHQDCEHKERLRVGPKTCPCGVKTENLEEFRKHLKDQHILWLTCPYCKHVCKDNMEYSRHRCHVMCGKDVEDCNSIYKCAICKTVFKSLMKLDQHCLENHQDVAPYTCHWCRERFTSIDERKVHMSDHLTALCEICYARVEPNDKHRHRDYHSGLGFACHICKTAFAKKTNFVQHMCIRHNDDQTWKIKCFVCSQKHRVHTYYHHLDTHEEIRICPKCPRMYQDIYNLKYHVTKSHPDYEVVNCEEYKMQFYNKWTLKSHVYHSNCSIHSL